jgi:hypothetical protein
MVRQWNLTVLQEVVHSHFLRKKYFAFLIHTGDAAIYECHRNIFKKWKFKSWCKIRRTVVSDNHRACAWRIADRSRICSTAFRTTSTFSGVLTVRSDPPCFFYVAEVVVRKLCTQRILPRRGTLKCRRNLLYVTVTDSPFLKNVSTTNARFWEPHCSMETETAKPYTSNAIHPMANGRTIFIH